MISSFWPRWTRPLAGLLALAVPAGAAARDQPGYILPDGSIQIICGDDYLDIVQRLDALYIKTHPGTSITARAANNLAALQTLVFDASALAPVGTDALGGAAVAYGAIVRGDPFLVRIAHASLQPSAALSPLALVVHPSNPLQSLSMDQVARIFTESMRKPNLATWSQVGLAGGWAQREIHPCGLPWSDHLPSEDPGFGDFVFLRKLGGGPPVKNYTMVEKYADVIRLVAADPAALGWVALNRVTPAVKVVALSGNAWAPAASGTAADIAAGRYPLDRYIYFFLRRVPGQPLDPFAEAYVQLALSAAGQQAIAAGGQGYIALNPVELGEELAKLQ